MDVKEALRLQQENNFVILDVRPEAEFKEVTCFIFIQDHYLSNIYYITKRRNRILDIGSPPRCCQRANIQAYKGVDGMGHR